MDFSSSFNGLLEGYYGFQQVLESGSSSLVLDKLDTVKPPHKVYCNEEKALISLRNHTEAERKRRERINGHLATLRSLIPGTNKMDKAALLAEVIKKVKELRQNVAETTAGTLMPTDIDELKVEEQETKNLTDNRTSFHVLASLSCDFRHEILSSLREAIESLPYKLVKAEISTLGSRMVTVFLISCINEDLNNRDGMAGQVLVNSVHQALQSVLDKFYSSEEFASTTLSGKRRRRSLCTSYP